MNELSKKYNVPGPRYTSYPTVPYWDTNPTEDQWIEHVSKTLARSSEQGLGAALYLHLPFCESLCTYCGCNTRITRNRGVSQPYIETLLLEWTQLLSRVGKSDSLHVSEIHVGGGTPTFLSASELDHLFESLSKRIHRSDDAEYSIEVDPRVTNKEQLAVLARHGFSRISLGVQDFDPKVQDIVNRTQSVEEVRKVTDDARLLGFNSVNFDLIYGLPLQTLQSIETTMRHVRDLKPDRIAFYAYAHVPWIKPGQRRFTEDDLPQGENKRALYVLGRSILEDAGYVEVGMDHFALKSDSLYAAVKNKTLHRNFMGYTARNVQPILGLGVSSISDAWTAFAQNEKLLETYTKRVHEGHVPIHRGHVLNPEDLSLRRHILNLMTEMQTKWDRNDPAAAFLQDVPARLTEMEQDELLQVSGTGIQVTEPGRAYLRNICMAFDARLIRKAPETKLFSQTV
jgi:oxygen-independent coproporphyrinogen III oxidase